MEKKNILSRWMLMLLTAVMMPLQAFADNSTNSTLSIEEFDIQAGETKEMLIDVDNPDQEVTMVEFYMQLPDGITVAEQNNEMLVDIAGRTTWKKHSLEVKTTNGSTHVLLYSGSNAILTGTSGAVISITLTASSTFNGGTIQLKRQLLTSPDKTESKPADYTYTIQGSEPQIPELNDGDVFTATNADGVEMTFEVISAADRTCMVRRRGMETHTIVTKPVPESVTIPAEVNGFKVVSIGYNAFYYCRSKSIIISEGVTSIGSFAFEGARLTDITIPKSMTNIEGGAFDDSNTSKNVYISDLSAWCKIKFEDNPLLGGHLFLNGEEVKDLVIPGDVTSLGDRNDMSLDSPFDGCVGLTSVTIPSTLTDIGYWGGFCDCPGIGSMIVESGNTVYDSRNNCNAIIETATATLVSGCKNTVIPNGIVAIGENAFSGCSGLTSITIPSSVTSVDPWSFRGCSNLTSVTVLSEEPVTIYSEFPNAANATLYVPKGSKAAYEAADYWKDFKEILEIEDETPEDIITFADLKVKAICVANWDTSGDGQLSKTEAAAVTSIGTVFKNSNITSFDELQYFTGLTEIEGRAFNNCQLTSVTIPNGVKTIGDAAFSQNEIASVSLPNTLESIGKYAFASNKLQSITIPQKVTTIEEGTFYNNELQSVSILGKVTAIGKDAFTYYQKITSFSISDLVSWCGMNADWYRDSNKGEKCCFYVNGHEVTDLVIPDGVTFIGKYTFMGLSGLTSLTIPEGVTSIQNSAFLGCVGLTSVTLPKSLTSIGDFVFQDSKGIATVTALMAEPFDFDPDASTFHYTIFDNAILYVPAGTKSLYKNAEGWKEFKNIVEMENGSPEDIITFADPKVKAICVTNWDTSGDGELSKAEAAAVTSLGDLFMGNSEITSFDELQYFTGLTTIPDYAFGGCWSLKSIRLPKSLTSIGEYAFEDCTSLETVVSFIETPFELGEGAFCARESYDGGNDWLEFDLHFSLYVPIGTKGLYRAAGWDVDESYGDYRTILSGTPENPGSFTVDGIVYDPIDATTVELTDDKNISGDITIPSTVSNGSASYQVTEIGACAFKGNTSLTSIVIPNCVKAIRPFAFNGCTGLTTVTSYIEKPFYLGAIKGVFLNNENVVFATYLQFTLYVPAGTKSLYEQASWTDASRIVEMGGDAYAIFDSTTGTLSFKFGEKPSGDNVYDAEDTKRKPGWRNQMTKVKKVVFDNSFALARPTSTSSWFAFEFGDDSSQFTEVIGIQNLNTSNVTNMSEMFSRCRSLTSLDLSHFETSNVTDMNSMFFSCTDLTSLDVSHFNTSNVTDMYHMFGDCSSLTSLDVSSFDTHNVQNMGGMFAGCKALTHINVDNFDTGNATSMMQMFGWCESLTSLDLRQFNTSNVTDMYMMFYACSNLTSICVSDKWSTEKITNGNNMFSSCNNLIGGKGTKHDYNHLDYTYAHIDGGADNPGYFTSAGKLGDANGDGYVNMSDVNAVKDYIMKGKTEGFNFFNADANSDKVVNAADIVKIINIID